MKAKLTKLLKSSIDIDKIADFLTSTFSDLFDLINKMKTQHHDLMENSKKVAEKLADMEKEQQKDRRCSQLAAEILKLKKSYKNPPSS
jgi:hemerythrin superfamily protein